MKFETAPAFYNTGSYYSTRISQRVNVDTDLTVGDDLSLTSDSAVFNMGAGNDFTITHDGTEGATLAGNPITITSAAAATWSTSSGALTITSAAAATWSTSAGVLTIDGDDGIKLQTTGSGNVEVAEILDITDSTDSSDATGDTGALRTEGGASIAKKLYVGDDLDLNSTGELLNVAASGNEWKAAEMTMTTSTSDAWLVFYQTLPASGTGAAITQYSQGDASGSANNMSYYVGYDAGNGYMKMRSRDTTSVASAGTHTDADIWRITDGTEVMILNANHGSNFDYVCDGCGKSAIASFECCGTVAWHDDVQALDNMALSRSGLEHMAKIGVMEISSDDETGAEWIGLNLQPAQMFTWSAMRQMYQRINELETKLKALGA